MGTFKNKHTTGDQRRKEIWSHRRLKAQVRLNKTIDRKVNAWKKKGVKEDEISKRVSDLRWEIANNRNRESPP
jgi:hypothetical protein